MTESAYLFTKIPGVDYVKLYNFRNTYKAVFSFGAGDTITEIHHVEIGTCYNFPVSVTQPAHIPTWCRGGYGGVREY